MILLFEKYNLNPNIGYLEGIDFYIFGEHKLNSSFKIGITSLGLRSHEGDAYKYKPYDIRVLHIDNIKDYSNENITRGFSKWEINDSLYCMRHLMKVLNSKFIKENYKIFQDE